MKKIQYIVLMFLLVAMATPSYSQVYNKQDKKFRHWQKAQHFKKAYRYWIAGLSVGTMTYKGDLNPKANLISTKVNASRLNVGAHLMWRWGPRITWRGSLSYGRIKGSDHKNAKPDKGDAGSEVARYTRNLSFRNDIVELNAGMMMDLFQNRKSMRRRMHWTPYGFVAIAGFYHSPKAFYDGKKYNLRKLGTEGQLIDGGKPYSAFQIAIPFGIGVRYQLSTSLDIAFEFGARWTSTDYLDDVSGIYADKVAIEKAGGRMAAILSDRSGEEAFHSRAVSELGITKQTIGDYNYTNSYTAGEQRGDPTAKDWYFVSGFHLTYIFRPKVHAARYKG